MKKRLISLFLAVLMVVSLFPAVQAASPEALWDYEQTADGIRLLAYRGSETNLTIPTELAGQMVVAIGDGCFRENTKLESVEIPYGIRSIGNEAFYRCTELTKATISGTVNIIGQRAFAHTDILSMQIPGSVHTIGNEAFRGCKGLLNLAFEGGIEDAEDIFPTSDDSGTGSVQMGEGVRTLGSHVFLDCVNLTRMRIPASVTAIGEQAIGYQSSANGIVLQKDYLIYGYTGTAGEQYARDNSIAFEIWGKADPISGQCGAYANWSFDSKNGTLTISGKGRMYDYGAAEYQPWHQYRSLIRTVVVEEGITALGAFALSGLSVTAVTLPNSLNQIRQKALSNCFSLAQIVFPGDAPRFFRDAFAGTTLLAWYPRNNATWTADVMDNYGGQITWRTEGQMPFVDVAEKSFCYDAVIWATDLGITKGMDATHFAPESPCTRGQVVTFLWRAMGSPRPAETDLPFVDVLPGTFCYDAVAWALEMGITTGMDAQHFSPSGLCTRAEAVTFLWRTVGRPTPISMEHPFTDVEANRWYHLPVVWAVEQGITKGMTPTLFGTENTCNRGQVVTFLYRLLK